MKKKTVKIRRTEGGFDMEIDFDNLTPGMIQFLDEERKRSREHLSKVLICVRWN